MAERSLSCQEENGNFNCRQREILVDVRQSSRNAVKATAVTAEITPRFRKPGWEFEKLDYLGEEKFYVRVTGWLMLDTEHVNNPIVRATNWEIHPVTKFEVCTLTKPKCDQGQGWVLLEEYEIQ